MTTTTAPTYTVEKNEYDVPCEHPLCEQLHQRFMTEVPRTGLVSASGYYVPATGVDRFHNRMVTEWVVMADGERVGDMDAFDTKRDALAAIAAIEAREALRAATAKAAAEMAVAIQTAVDADTRECATCHTDLPITKFPTRKVKAGIVRGTTCRKCRDAR